MTERPATGQTNDTGGQKAASSNAPAPPAKPATPFVPVKSKAREFSEEVVTFTLEQDERRH
jgi:hypothetical protein